jgi:hypothetical protein
MLALLAITQNYGEFSKGNYAMNTETFSNDFYMPKVNTVQDEEEKPKYAIVGRNDGLAATKFRKKSSVISNGKRKMF